MEMETIHEQRRDPHPHQDVSAPPGTPSFSEPFYVPGYEPSAPPAPPEPESTFYGYGQDQLHHLKPFTDSHEAPSPPQQAKPTRLVDILSGPFQRFWRTSHTVLRLDLSRSVKADDPVVKSGGAGRNSRYNRYSHYNDTEGPSLSWIQGIYGSGAQLKLMQVWQFPDDETGLPSLPWNPNFGLGVKVEMDGGGHLVPQMRVRTKHLSFHLLPSPLLELRGKWPLGGTRLAINIRYRVPFTDLESFWESPASQLYVNLYNPVGTGLHLSPGGLEFDEHVINIGQHSKLRVAASVEFPRHFPLEEGEQPLRVRINRLGIKTRIS